MVRDYATPALIAMIGYFDYLEPYIGDHIRGVSADSLRKIGVNRDRLLGQIFDNRIRGAFGLFAACCMGLSIAFLFYAHIWYSSLPVTAYLIVLAELVVFILGEAVAGALITVINVYKIGIKIERVDIFELKQLSTLRAMGNWCLLIAAIGGIVSALAFPAFFFAPWVGATPVFALWGELLMIAEVPILCSLFILPLASLHSALVRSKMEHLETMYKGYRDLHSKLMPIMRDKSMDEVIMESERLTDAFTNINVMLNLINEAPDWPWDPAVFQTLIATLVASVVSYVIFQIA